VNLDELRHVVRAAARVTGVRDIVVIGSQAVLGSFQDATPLPIEATRSREADLAIDAETAHFDLGVDTSELADQIDAALGEHSQFDATFGYYAQGVEITTATLPAGWRNRLVPVASEDHAGEAVAIGWCLEVHDAWAAKAAAGREKDYEFCVALADAGLLVEATCRERIADFSGADAVRAEALATRCFRRSSRRTHSHSGPVRPRYM
jgi:hypothetical protein